MDGFYQHSDGPENQRICQTCLKIVEILSSFISVRGSILSKMPVDGLPLVLEKTLETLLEGYTMSSWNIRGGNEFTQVTLRFAVSGPKMDTIDNRYYKRKSRSQVVRDSVRLGEWKNKHHNEALCSDLATCNMNADKDKSTGNISDTSSVLDTQENQQPILEDYDIPDNSSHHSFNERSSTMGGLVPELVEKASISRVGSANPLPLGLDVGDVNTHRKDIDTNSIDLSSSDSHRTDLSKDSRKEIFNCGICNNPIKGKLGDKWYKCSHCEDLYICQECNKNSLHQIHRDQIHEYTWLFDVNSSCYQYFCDCCGFRYDYFNENFRVWQCTRCGDYTLCKRCKEQNMHSKHRYYMTNKLLSEYEDEL